jgi:hypothetical protein
MIVALSLGTNSCKSLSFSSYPLLLSNYNRVNRRGRDYCIVIKISSSTSVRGRNNRVSSNYVSSNRSSASYAKIAEVAFRQFRERLFSEE